MFYTIRSERLLMEQLDYNLLYRWFVGLSMDDAVWDHSVFSKNRDRLLNTEMASFLFSSIRDQAKKKNRISDEHFTVDGTLLEAWALMKSFRAKDSDDNSDDDPGRIRPLTFAARKEPMIRMVPPPTRCPVMQKSQRAAIQALLHGPCVDGKPQWPCCRYPCNGGQRNV